MALMLEQKQEIGRRYQAGETTVALAKAFGVSVKTICNILHQLGIPIRGRYTEEQVDRAIDLCVNDGLSGEAAGAAVGISESTVFKELKKRGITLPHGCDAKFNPEKIIEHYRTHEGATIYDTAAAIGCSPMTVSKVLKKHDEATRWQGKRLNEEEQAVALGMTLRGEKIGDMAEHFDVNRKTIGRFVQRTGIILPTGRPQTHNLNHATFDEITPESAYWIGFLMADGCLHYDEDGQAVIAMALQERDLLHVQKFRTFIGSTHNIQRVPGKPEGGSYGIKSGPGVSLHVRSDRIGKMLAARGMVAGKPDRGPIPELDDSPDFWRGMVDGDGSVGTTGDYYNYATISLCGQLKICEAFAAFMLRRVGARLTPKPTTTNIWHVQTSGSTARNALRLLYENACVALDRKAAVVREII